MKRIDNVLFDSQQKKFFANIYGELIEVGGNSTGVTSVSTLPATGEEGKIYYNTTDNKYYIYNTDSGFSTLGDDILVDDVMLTALGSDGYTTAGSVTVYRDEAEILNPGTPIYDYNSEAFVVPRFITEEEFNALVTAGQYTGTYQEYVENYENGLDDALYVIEPYTGAIDTDAIHYISWCRTWYKFERVVRSTMPASYKYVPMHLYTGTMMQNVTISKEQLSNDDVAAVSLNPSVYSEISSIDKLTFFDTGYKYRDTSMVKYIPVCGRFIANKANVSIILPDYISPAASNPSIEATKVYEYRIFDGIFSLIDVTAVVVQEEVNDGK